MQKQKRLIILRGLPGSGKSTFLKKYQLEGYTVCPDEIRLELEAPLKDENGKLYISQKNNKKVWGIAFQRLEEKMKKEEIVIMDATHTTFKSIQTYQQLLKKYDYKVLVIDFSSIPLSKIKEQNQLREEFRIVPEEVIDRMYKNIIKQEIPDFVEIVDFKDFDGSLVS
jgi:predicted kinase